VQITQWKTGDLVVLSIEGDMTMPADGAVVFADAVRTVLQQGCKRLVVDVASVTYVDSWGLGELVQSNSAAHARGASFTLLHVTPRLANLLACTQLRAVFDCRDDERDVFSTPADPPSSRA
jgi:anti-sigma B factor antagonist